MKVSNRVLALPRVGGHIPGPGVDEKKAAQGLVIGAAFGMRLR